MRSIAHCHHTRADAATLDVGHRVVRATGTGMIGEHARDGRRSERGGGRTESPPDHDGPGARMSAPAERGRARDAPRGGADPHSLVRRLTANATTA